MDERHNYVKKINRMIANGQIPFKVGLGHLYIAHDDWCAVYKDGLCNCDPDIKYKPPES